MSPQGRLKVLDRKIKAYIFETGNSKKQVRYGQQKDGVVTP